MTTSPSAASRCTTGIDYARFPYQELREDSPEKSICRGFAAQNLAQREALFRQQEATQECALIAFSTSPIQQHSKMGVIPKMVQHIQEPSQPPVTVDTVLANWVAQCPGKETKNRKKAAERIREFLQNPSITQLNLSNLSLTSLPPVFQHPDFVTRLTSLNLSENKLTDFPEEIFEFLSLEELHLNSNQLTDLSEKVCQLDTLRSLHLSNNRLTSLPLTICLMRTLNFLYLDRNELKALPEDIDELRALKLLYVHHNSLEALPQTIGKLQALEYFAFDRNTMTTIPAEEIASLQALQKLSIFYETKAFGIAQQFFKLPPSCQINLIATSLSPFLAKTIKTTEIEDYQGPRLKFITKSPTS